LSRIFDDGAIAWQAVLVPATESRKALTAVKNTPINGGWRRAVHKNKRIRTAC